MHIRRLLSYLEIFYSCITLNRKLNIIEIFNVNIKDYNLLFHINKSCLYHNHKRGRLLHCYYQFLAYKYFLNSVGNNTKTSKCYCFDKKSSGRGILNDMVELDGFFNYFYYTINLNNYFRQLSFIDGIIHFNCEEKTLSYRIPKSVLSFTHSRKSSCKYKIFFQENHLGRFSSFMALCFL